MHPIEYFESHKEHLGRAEVVVKNIYGTSQGTRIFTDGVHAHLVENGWKYLVADRNVYMKMK